MQISKKRVALALSLALTALVFVGDAAAGVGRPSESTDGVGRPSEGTDGVGRPSEGTDGVGRPSEGTDGVGRPSDWGWSTEGACADDDGSVQDDRYGWSWGSLFCGN